MGAVVRLRDRRTTPASAVVLAAMESQALASELRADAESLLAEWAWADRNRSLISRLSRMVRHSVAIEEASRLVAGAAEGIADPDGIARPGHGRAA